MVVIFSHSDGDGGSTLTCLGYLNQLFVTELIHVLFHLGDWLGDGVEGEVGVHGDCGQLLRLSLGDQHVVALTGRDSKMFQELMEVLWLIRAVSPVLFLPDLSLKVLFFSFTWMKWMWSSVRDSWVISVSLLLRSAISLLRRSMWPSALLRAALLLEEIILVISCCILSMERIMSPNIFSHSCRARWAEFCTGNTEVCNKSTGCHAAFTSTLWESVITPNMQECSLLVADLPFHSTCCGGASLIGIMDDCDTNLKGVHCLL